MLDKYIPKCYTIIRKREEQNLKSKGEWNMKYRVIDKNGYYFPTYFKTKREANEFIDKMANVFAGEVERKIGGNWCKY